MLIKRKGTLHDPRGKNKNLGEGRGVGRKQWLSKTMCEPNFNCPLCDATFVRIDSIQSHLRQHQKLQPHLQQEIFSIQQQLLQQQQINHQQSSRPKAKRNGVKLNVSMNAQQVILSSTPASSKLKSSQAAQVDKKLSDETSSTLKNQNMSLITSRREIASTSSTSLTSSTTSPTNSGTVMNHENSNNPITLIMSPARSGKTSLQNSRDIQAISHNTLQGLSYIAIPPSSLENSTSVEQNLTTLSIPVTTEGKLIYYGIAIFWRRVSGYHIGQFYCICHPLLIDEGIGIQPSTNDKSTLIDSTGSVNTITLIQQPNGQVRRNKEPKVFDSSKH